MRFTSSIPEKVLKRCEELSVSFLVTHLGSHLGSGKAVGFKRIAEAVNSAFSEVKGETMLLLENTAGTENSMGHLSRILGRLLTE